MCKMHACLTAPICTLYLSHRVLNLAWLRFTHQLSSREVKLVSRCCHRSERSPARHVQCSVHGTQRSTPVGPALCAYDLTDTVHKKHGALCDHRHLVTFYTGVPYTPRAAVPLYSQAELVLHEGGHHVNHQPRTSAWLV